MEFKFFQSDMEIGVVRDHEFFGVIEDIDSQGLFKSVDFFSQSCSYSGIFGYSKIIFLQEGFVDKDWLYFGDMEKYGCVVFVYFDPILFDSQYHYGFIVFGVEDNVSEHQFLCFHISSMSVMFEWSLSSSRWYIHISV